MKHWLLHHHLYGGHELEGVRDEDTPATSMYFDSKSAIAIGVNYKDTKHTRHIMRRYHYV
jgi:hypothetical protein